MYIVGHNIGKSKHPNNETCSHHCYSARKGNTEMSDNPNFIVRFMSDKRNPAQPTIHVGYADSGLTDTPHIRHQFRQSPHLSVKTGLHCTCFIDFKKAFDSIWHEGMFYKMEVNGFSGKLLKLIRDIYKKTKCAIKIKDSVTDYFDYTRGG